MSDKKDSDINKENKVKDNKKNNKSTKSVWYIWGIKIFVLSFILTMIFSFFTEIVISDSSFIICILVLFILLLINIVCDILATAVTACKINPFLAMSSKKIKGAKTAVLMCKNSHKMASICADIVGDICGIISGSAGASLVLILFSNSEKGIKEMIYAILISSIIAAFTVGGKAFGKTLAIKNNQQIVFFFAKIFSFFKKEK